jgi:hypothetical protein
MGGSTTTLDVPVTDRWRDVLAAFVVKRGGGGYLDAYLVNNVSTLELDDMVEHRDVQGCSPLHVRCRVRGGMPTGDPEAGPSGMPTGVPRAPPTLDGIKVSI